MDKFSRARNPIDLQEDRCAPHAFELGWIITDRGGLRLSDIDALNHALRRMLWNRGDYVRPIELVHQRLNARGLTA